MTLKICIKKHNKKPIFIKTHIKRNAKHETPPPYSKMNTTSHKASEDIHEKHPKTRFHTQKQAK